MARPKVLDHPKYRLSIVLDDDTKDLLDKVSDRYGAKYSKMIPKLLHEICDMTPSVKSSVLDFLVKKIEQNKEILRVCNKEEKETLLKDQEEYLNIYQLITQGIAFPEDDSIDMTYVQIKNQSLVRYPKEWIVLNPEEALECRYAGVVTLRGVADTVEKQYAHILFFSEQDDEYTEDEYKKILSRCCGISRKIDDIIRGQCFLNFKHKREDDLLFVSKISISPLPEKKGKLAEGNYLYGACILRQDQCS